MGSKSQTGSKWPDRPVMLLSVALTETAIRGNSSVVVFWPRATSAFRSAALVKSAPQAGGAGLVGALLVAGH